MSTSEEMQQIELTIGKILRLGVVISSVVMIIGFLMLIFTGQTGYSGDYWPKRVHEIAAGLISFKPYAWLMTGLFLLILTPVLRVLISIYAFMKEKDSLYVWITTFVLVILIIAMIIGNII